MFKNYLTIALRNLLKYKTYTMISICGIALGMACCLIISLYVYHELSYDNFHKDSDRIFRVIFGKNVITPEPLAQFLEKNFPEVEHVFRIEHAGNQKLFGHKGLNSYEDNFYYAEPAFFEVFSFPLKNSNRKYVFQNPNSIIISEKIAKKYFGNDNPIGKIITLENKRDFEVTGIFAKRERPSHLEIDFLAPFQKIGYSKWFFFSCITYLKLYKGVNPIEFENKFLTIYKEYANVASTQYYTSSFYLQPITDINLQPAFDFENIRGNIRRNLAIFSGIAFVILVISCLNFANLSMAHSLARSHEAGIRRIMGAKKLHLFTQNVVESMVIILFAVIFGILLIELLLPLVSDIIGMPSKIYNYNIKFSMITGLSIIFISVFISAIQPALYFSANKPFEVVKGMLTSGPKSLFLKKALIIFQFTITISLLINTVVILKQLKYTQKKNLGFDKENVIVIRDRVDITDKHFDSLKSELLAIPQVLSVSHGELPYSDVRESLYEQPYTSSSAEPVRLRKIKVGYDYIKTLRINIVEGRGFSPMYGGDVASHHVLVNKTAIKQFGWSQPIGKAFKKGEEKYSIIGVFEDVHFGSLHEYIWPTMLELDPNANQNRIIVRVKYGDMKETIEKLKETWNHFAPFAPLNFCFLDGKVNSMYRAEQRTSKLFILFTLITIFVSCIGLYGILAFSTEQRTKEIGIRKVLGASVQDIISLTTREFFLLVIMSNLIAWPIAYYAMNNWLQNFAYRINIGWWIFVLSGIIALMVALLTVSYQSIKAAVVNPVKSLRYE